MSAREHDADADADNDHHQQHAPLKCSPPPVSIDLARYWSPLPSAQSTVGTIITAHLLEDLVAAGWDPRAGRLPSHDVGHAVCQITLALSHLADCVSRLDTWFARSPSEDAFSGFPALPDKTTLLQHFHHTYDVTSPSLWGITSPASSQILPRHGQPHEDAATAARLRTRGRFTIEKVHKHLWSVWDEQGSSGKRSVDAQGLIINFAHYWHKFETLETSSRTPAQNAERNQNHIPLMPPVPAPVSRQTTSNTPSEPAPITPSPSREHYYAANSNYTKGLGGDQVQPPASIWNFRRLLSLLPEAASEYFWLPEHP